MLITQLSISNYKSLRAITITPGQLSVIVGANAAGKSNFADCVDFISDVYRHGLEVAVGRKGGYENIAFRRQRRSKLPIKIQLVVEIAGKELKSPSLDSSQSYRIEHSFAFVARGFSIRTPYEIIEEELIISQQTFSAWEILVTIKRHAQELDVASIYKDQTLDQNPSTDRALRRNFFYLSGVTLFQHSFSEQSISTSELFITPLRIFVPAIADLIRLLGNVRVFQISPSRSREHGVPSSSPELERLGSNLPAVIDVMQKENSAAWNSVMEVMRGILPDLMSIDVDYTPSRTLSLFFKEKNSGRPWTTDEVSDGTIQTLALVVAIFDPTSPAIVIEEPENSVHPWITRRILAVCRESQSRKQIIITTHSPIVINAVRPNEVWVIWRTKGESHLEQLVQLDPTFLAMWREGVIPTFDFIDSGALLEALPPAPGEYFDFAEEALADAK